MIIKHANNSRKKATSNQLAIYSSTAGHFGPFQSIGSLFMGPKNNDKSDNEFY